MNFDYSFKKDPSFFPAKEQTSLFKKESSDTAPKTENSLFEKDVSSFSSPSQQKRPSQKVEQVKQHLGHIFSTCESARDLQKKNQQAKSYLAAQAQIEKAVEELQQIRGDFVLGNIILSQPEAEETIAFFNKITAFVNQCLSAEIVEELPSYEVLNLASHPDFQHLPPLEQKFIQLLTLKNLGHLLGDSFIRGKVDCQGRHLEGSNQQEMMQFILNALDYLAVQYPEKFEGKEKELQQFKQLVHTSLAIASSLKRVLAADSNELKEELFISFIENLQDQLQNLNEDETILIPWGWSSVAVGHAMQISASKREGAIHLTVVNTGAGVGFHDRAVGHDSIKPFRVNTLCHYTIGPKEQDKFYRETLPALFEPTILGSLNAPGEIMDNNQPYEAEELYLMLEPYRSFATTLNKAHTQHIKGSQQSGTCAFQSTFTCFAKMMSEEFHKEVKFLWEQESASQLLKFHDYFLMVDPLYEVFLQRLNPNLFRHLEKLQKQGLPENEGTKLLAKFEMQSLTIEALTKEHKESNRPLSMQFEPEWIADDTAAICSERKAVLKPALDLISTANAAEPIEVDEKLLPTVMKPLNAGELAAMEPQNLLKMLQAGRENLASDKKLELKNNWSHWGSMLPKELFYGKQIQLLVDLFTNPTHENEKNLLFHKLNDSPKLVASFMEEFSLIATAIEKTELLKLEISNVLALEGLRLATYDLGVLNDDQLGIEGMQRLDHWDLRFSLSWENLMLSPYTLHSPQAEQEYAQIKHAFERRFPKKTSCLCDVIMLAPNDYDEKNSLSFKSSNKSSNDYRFALKFVDTLTENDLNQMQASYQSFCSDTMANLDQNEFNACWMMVNKKLPLSYRTLFTVSLASAVTSPSSYVAKTEKDEFLDKLTLITEFDFFKLKCNFQSLSAKNYTHFPLLPPANIRLTYNTDYEFPLLPTPQNSSLTKIFGPKFRLKINSPAKLEQKVSDESAQKKASQKLHNDHLAKLNRKELTALLAIEHPLQLPMLFDYYLKYPELLLQIEHRLALELLLLSPMKLYRGLENNPFLAQEVTLFFEKLSSALQLKKINLTNSREIQSIYAFVLEQKVRAYQTVAFCNQDSQQLKAVRKEITSQLQGADSNDVEIMLPLLSAYIGTFASFSPWSFEETPMVLDCFRMLLKLMSTSDMPDNLLWTNSYLRVSELLLRNLDSIVEFVSGDSSRSWVESLIEGRKALHWELQPFPFLKIATSSSVEWVNLLSGENLTKHQGESKLVPSDFLSQSSYKTTFQSKKVVAEEKGNYKLVKHATGTYRIWPSRIMDTGEVSPFTMEKEIDGKRHISIALEDLHLDSIPNVDAWQLWLNIEETSHQVVIIDKNSQEVIGSIAANGTIELNGPPSSSYRYSLNPPWAHAFFDHAQEFLWTHKIDHEGKQTDSIKLSYKGDDGSALEFYKSQGKWIFNRDPRYFIAEEQELVGLTCAHQYLILQDRQGNKIALIPELPSSLLTTPKKEQKVSDRESPEDSSLSSKDAYVIVALGKENRIPLQDASYKNYFVAYHLMMQARTPKQYVKAFEYLKDTQEFRPYSDKELKILGMIAYSHKEKINDDPEAQVMRLYAAYLIHDNLVRYPSGRNEEQASATGFFAMLQEPSPPKVMESEVNWAEYLQKMLMGKLNRSDLNDISIAYTRNQNNVPAQLRIEKIIPPYPLKQWGFPPSFGKMVTHKRLVIPQKFPLAETIAFNNVPRLNSPAKKPPTFITRLDKQFSLPSESTFAYLFNLACSSQDADRQYVVNFLRKSLFEKKSINRELCSLLVIALEGQKESSPLQKTAQKLLDLSNKYQETSSSYRQNKLKEKFSALYTNFLQSYGEAEATSQPILNPATAKTKGPRITLPQEPFQGFFSYTAEDKLFEPFQLMAQSYFHDKEVSDPQLSSPNKFFPELMPEIQQLNEEYLTGHNQNFAKQHPRLKDDSLKVREGLLKEKKHLEMLHEKDAEEAKQLAKSIVAVGNRQLKEAARPRAKVGGGKKQHLNLDSLILLALENDSHAIKKATAISDPDEQMKLMNDIGRYLELEMRLRHSQAISKGLEALEAALPENCLSQLTTLQELLQAPCAMVQHSNTLIQLVFQHFIGLNFRANQVEGLDKMIAKDSNIFLQRGTGEGKTLVLAHMLAYYNADGYHLSIHVSPTYQFASQIYEMSERSQKALDQRAHALIFYDSPEYTDVKSLQRLKEELIAGIEQRDYFNTTITTLRTLRAAYLHAAHEYFSNSSLSADEHQALGKKKDLLCDINALIRSRGIFTLDEVVDAQNAKIILNKGMGEKTTLDDLHLELMSTMLMLAIQEKNELGKPLIPIKENLQALTTPEEKAALAQKLATFIINDPKWLKKLDCDKLSKTEIMELREFLLDKDAPMPSFVANKIASFERKGSEMTPLDHLLLCRQLLAGQWLCESLSRSVYEHFGVVYQEGLLPIAVPFSANLKPSKKSEFSDPYRMGLNTLIAYHVQGLSLEQTKEFVTYLRLQGLKEMEQKRESMTLEETEAFRAFAQVMAPFDSEMQLIDVSVHDESSLQIIQQALNAPTKVAMQMLSNYVAANVIKRKTLSNEQVACNGMNTASMAKSINGFSASIDNLHIGPVMDFKGTKTTIETDKGVFGQRIDSLISKHTDVYVMRNSPRAIFDDVYQKLPLEKRERFRAIIDVGCHFRGVDNIEVAKMMCQELQDSPAKGVIFYDIDSDRPYYMDKSNPSQIRLINSFDTKEIEGVLYFEDLNLPVDAAAVYFSQDKIIGTNISLMKNAIAISTFAEKTKFEDKIQGDGRMRQIDKGQEIVTAVQQGALQQISTMLENDEIQHLALGQVVDKEFIRQLILYAYYLQVKGRKEDTFLLSMQNLSNTVQQYLLDKIYSDRTLQEKVFTECGHLFKENIDIDFIRDYGMPKTSVGKELYFSVAIAKLLRSLIPLPLPTEEIQELKKTLEMIKNSALPDIENQIQVDAIELDSEQGPQAKKMTDGTTLQIHEKQSLKVQDQLSVKEWIQNKHNEKIFPGFRSAIDEKEFFSPDFASVELMPLKILDGVLSETFPSQWGKASIFSKNLLATNNYLETVDKIYNPNTYNLLDDFQKPMLHLLLIQDGKEHSKLLILDAVDAEEAARFLAKAEGKLPKDRNMWLLRPQGELAWPGSAPYDKQSLLDQPDVRSLLVQANFFAANLHNLETDYFQKGLVEWLQTVDDPQVAISYFENAVLATQPLENYLYSKTRKTLSALKAT